jgi:DNA repair exonuclease SbcCD nuclease subunit
VKDLSILFTADWHLDSSPARWKKAEASLDQIGNYLVENPIDYFVHSGDIWEALQDYMKGSGVELGHQYLREFSKLVKFLLITKGNNAHDKPGSVALLNQLEKNILAYEYPVINAIYESGLVADMLRMEWTEEAQEYYSNPELVINLMPYPTKSNIITDTSIDINNANYGQVFDGMMDVFGIINSRFTCPKIMGIHANIQGSRLSTGQTLNSQDIMISPHSLDRAKCDFIGAGHIHMEQEITPNIHFISSLYNCNHGEEEQKYFKVVKFNSDGMRIEKIPLIAARPMVTVLAELKEGMIVYSREVPENSEVKVKLSIPENEKGLYTDDKKKELEERFGIDVKIDKIIVPAQRESRSEKIMIAKGEVEEVAEYARVIKETDMFTNNDLDKPLKKTVLKKIDKIVSGEIDNKNFIESDLSNELPEKQLQGRIIPRQELEEVESL